MRAAFTDGPRAILVRGLSVESCGEQAFADGFAAIGNWLGTASPQSIAGELVARVEARSDDPQRRGTHSEDELQPHTDLHDILALGCVRQAASGGQSFLVAGEALRRRMALDHPHSLAVLEEGYYFGTNPALHSSQPVSKSKVPVFGAAQEGGFVCWNGYFLHAAAASRGEAIPPELDDALARLRGVAADLAAINSFPLVPGDMLFWHNWSWLHGRTAFKDDPAAPRLLLRLWLRSQIVPRPDVLAQLAARIDADHILTSALGYRQP